MTDAELLAWLAGATEPPRALEIEEEVAADPLAQARLAALSAMLRVDLAPPSWRIPPPGVPGGRRGFGLAPVTDVMGEALRPGDRFRVRIAGAGDLDRRVVVLFEGEAGWEVLFPLAPDQDLRLSELPAEADGARVLDLAARAAPARQRWAVALPEADPVDWALPPRERWAALRAGVAAGTVAVTAVEVAVAPTP